MKKLLSTILLLGAVMTAGATEVPQVMNILGRQTTSLNGAWNYIVDVQEEGYYDYRMNPYDWGFFRNAKPQRPEDLIEYDFDKAETMQVPGDWIPFPSLAALSPSLLSDSESVFSCSSMMTGGICFRE